MRVKQGRRAGLEGRAGVQVREWLRVMPKNSVLLIPANVSLKQSLVGVYRAGSDSGFYTQYPSDCGGFSNILNHYNCSGNWFWPRTNNFLYYSFVPHVVGFNWSVLPPAPFLQFRLFPTDMERR